MSELPVGWGWVLVIVAAGIFVFWLTKSEEGRRFRERVMRIRYLPIKECRPSIEVCDERARPTIVAAPDNEVP
jgi:hypothetical protein